jgi:hypothetical protein
MEIFSFDSNFDNSPSYWIAITKNYQDQIVSLLMYIKERNFTHLYTQRNRRKGQGRVGTEIITGMQYDYYIDVL